jgi:drug/metabolite transporter (DMT)-like permease
VLFSVWLGAEHLTAATIGGGAAVLAAVLTVALRGRAAKET